MGLLIEDVEKHPKQAVAICEMVCKKLQFRLNKKTKIWDKSCTIVTDIYNGDYLFKNTFNERKEDSFNYYDTAQRILECKGDWVKVKQLFLTIIDNLHFALLEQYMPLKKTSLMNLTFSTFFDSYFSTTPVFYDLVDPPKKREEFFRKEHVEKIKKEIRGKNGAMFCKKGEDICKQYFSYNERIVCNFWDSLFDMFKWWMLIKEFRQDLYSDLKSRFIEKNLLVDYHKWLVNQLKEWDGKNFHLEPHYYRVGSPETNRLYSYFSVYIKEKIKESNLNEDILALYKPEAFKSTLVAEENVPEDVEYLTGEEEIIF